MDRCLDAIQFLNRNRPSATDYRPLLCAIVQELAQHAGNDQLRSLMLMAGGRVAAEHPLEGVDRLSDFEREAREVLARYDWGWLQVENDADGIELVHGDAPLERLFGDGCDDWAPAFFEGLFGGWLRQLGADKPLEFRQVGAESASGIEGPIRFRLMHASRF